MAKDLNTTIFRNGKHAEIRFSEPTAWVRFGPEQAAQIALALAKIAEQISVDNQVDKIMEEAAKGKQPH